VVGDALCAFLKATANNSRLVIDLADNQDGTDYPRSKTL
jgi:hypothetical protein